MRYAEFAPIETERLMLRRLCLEDVQDYYERVASDGDVTRYMLLDPHQDLTESLLSIENTLQRYEEGRCYRWGIALKSDDSIIGVIDLLRFDEEEGSCSFAYMIGCDYWNRGYGTETLKAVLTFAFEKMEIEWVRADHMAENLASGAVMRKAGMRCTGTVPGKYEKYGVLHDAVCYEIRSQRKPLTANEYQSLAMKTLNPRLQKKDVLINGVMGLCGESGEAIDLVKKHLHQGHPLDREKLAKELGDIAWYLAETAYALELPLEDILRANIAKLKRRYPEGFDTERSVNR